MVEASVFWDVSLRHWVIKHFDCRRWDPLGCTETSDTNNPVTQRHTPDEWRPPRMNFGSRLWLAVRFTTRSQFSRYNHLRGELLGTRGRLDAVTNRKFHAPIWTESSKKPTSISVSQRYSGIYGSSFKVKLHFINRDVTNRMQCDQFMAE